MRTRILAPLVTAAMAGGLLVSVAGPATAAGPATQVSAAAPTQTTRAVATSTINEAVTFADGTVGNLTGTFTPTQFVNQNGQLGVQGLLSGTLTNAAGTVLGTVTDVPITTTVSNAATSGSCDVLHLTLGPLHLNLLGLVVDLNQIKLDITAQRGPGNLLGNLLCAVTGILDNNGLGLQGVVNILNNILGGL